MKFSKEVAGREGELEVSYNDLMTLLAKITPENCFDALKADGEFKFGVYTFKVKPDDWNLPEDKE